MCRRYEFPEFVGIAAHLALDHDPSLARAHQTQIDKLAPSSSRCVPLTVVPYGVISPRRYGGEFSRRNVHESAPLAPSQSRTFIATNQGSNQRGNQNQPFTQQPDDRTKNGDGDQCAIQAPRSTALSFGLTDRLHSWHAGNF
jgi:hypothetical protein